MTAAVKLHLDRIRVDGGTQTRAALSQDTVADYAEILASLPPVVVFHDGADYWLADGFHRVAAARQAGVQKVAADIHQGDRREAQLWSLSANAAHGLRRTNADKRRGVEMLLRDEEWSRWSDRVIAKRAAVSHVYVAQLRAELAGGNVTTCEPAVTRRGADGKAYPTGLDRRANGYHPPVEHTAPEQPAEPAPPPPEAAADPAPEADDLDLDDLDDDDRRSLALSAKHSMASQEWYTPPELVARVRQVLGVVDLDPASCPEANRGLGARRIFTAADDGVTQRWPAGSVYCNPPGGRRGAGQSHALIFWGLLMGHRAAGLLTHGIFYAFNGEMIQVSQGRSYPAVTAFPICAPARRVKMIAPGGQPGTSPTHSSLVVYVPGTVDRSDTFATVFRDVGAILVPWGAETGKLGGGR